MNAQEIAQAIIEHFANDIPKVSCQHEPDDVDLPEYIHDEIDKRLSDLDDISYFDIRADVIGILMAYK